MIPRINKFKMLIEYNHMIKIRSKIILITFTELTQIIKTEMEKVIRHSKKI